jgi:hypothetical protein
VVVCTEVAVAKAKEVDAFCHANSIAFIRGDVRGVFGSLFCDFGPAFDVHDTDGEEPHTCIVASVSNDETPLVTCVDDDRVVGTPYNLNPAETHSVKGKRLVLLAVRLVQLVSRLGAITPVCPSLFNSWFQPLNL